MATFPSIYSVACHTNNVGAGSTFVVIKGHKEDGVRYIPQALQKGATKIVVEKTALLSQEIVDEIARHNAELVRVDNARAALAKLSAQALGNPAKKLKILAVTGTKGKTTSSFLLEHVLRSAGYKTALLSTVYNTIGDQKFTTSLTTQHPDYLHQFFKLCVEAGIEYVVMETAAQAFSLHRVDGLHFDGAIFTNFSQEHAEFYLSMEDYFAAKCTLFTQLKEDAPCLINADDQWLHKENIQKKYTQLRAVDFALSHDHNADYRATVQGSGLDKLTINIENNAVNCNVTCASLVGAFNAYNIVGVVGLCAELGMTVDSIVRGVASFTRVPGRLERYQLPNSANCFIDYAHNPSSYQAVLSMMRELAPHLIVVFGCGGDRDKTKRPVMGAIAAQFADVVIVTSDNPRSEDAAVIAQEIIGGVPPALANKVVLELDREQAIKKAYALSKPVSVIMLLGKGPDEYQQIGAIKHPFSEKAIVQAL